MIAEHLLCHHLLARPSSSYKNTSLEWYEHHLIFSSIPRKQSYICVHLVSHSSCATLSSWAVSIHLFLSTYPFLKFEESILASYVARLHVWTRRQFSSCKSTIDRRFETNVALAASTHTMSTRLPEMVAHLKER